MNRLLIASLALSLLGWSVAVAQPSNQPDTPGATLSSSTSGQTVDEGTLMERRLAASGRTHGSYRAAPAHHAGGRHAGGRHHGRAGRSRSGKGRHHARAGHTKAARGHKAHGHASHARHHAAPVHHRRHH